MYTTAIMMSSSFYSLFESHVGRTFDGKKRDESHIAWKNVMKKKTEQVSCCLEKCDEKKMEQVPYCLKWPIGIIRKRGNSF